MIESLLKLKCQQALAQGDYDSLSSYSQQLVMFQQGTLIGEMPIGEELKELQEAYECFTYGEVPMDFVLERLTKFYGEDLTKVCVHFLKSYNNANFVDELS